MLFATIAAEAARLARGAGAGALASVARRRGSLPMSGTAKMLVAAGGARFGTVGGGCLEAEIIERALDVIERRVPAVSEHTLNAELAGDSGLTCGGTATMVIEPVCPDPGLAAVWDAVSGVLARGGRAVLATALDWSAGPAKVLVAGDAIVGHPDAALRAAAARAAGDPASLETPRLDDTMLLELVAGAPRLVVFGAGHVGAKIGEAAAFAGWRVTIVDDRAEYADAARLAFAERVVICDWHDLPVTLGLDDAAYAVICTRGHQHDATIAEQLARRDLRYLGMLGSRRKVELTWRLLERAGVPRERLERVHAPVGIAIGADTPEEIAISVVGEMIAVRRSDTRRRGGIELPPEASRPVPDHWRALL